MCYSFFSSKTAHNDKTIKIQILNHCRGAKRKREKCGISPSRVDPGSHKD